MINQVVSIIKCLDKHISHHIKNTIITKAHRRPQFHIKAPRRLMKMQDLGRNLWSQDLALIPFVTTPNS